MGIEKRGEHLVTCPFTDFSPKGLSQLIPIPMQSDPVITRLIERLSTTKFTKYILKDIRARVIELGGYPRPVNTQPSKATTKPAATTKKKKHHYRNSLLLMQDNGLRIVLRGEGKTERMVDAILKQWRGTNKITQEVFEKNMGIVSSKPAPQHNDDAYSDYDLPFEPGVFFFGKPVNNLASPTRTQV